MTEQIRVIDLASVCDPEDVPLEVVRVVFEALYDEEWYAKDDGEYLKIRDGERSYTVPAQFLYDVRRIYAFINRLPYLARPLGVEMILEDLGDALFSENVKKGNGE